MLLLLLFLPAALPLPDSPHTSAPLLLSVYILFLHIRWHLPIQLPSILPQDLWSSPRIPDTAFRHIHFPSSVRFWHTENLLHWQMPYLNTHPSLSVQDNPLLRFFYLTDSSHLKLPQSPPAAGSVLLPSGQRLVPCEEMRSLHL